MGNHTVKSPGRWEFWSPPTLLGDDLVPHLDPAAIEPGFLIVQISFSHSLNVQGEYQFMSLQKTLGVFVLGLVSVVVSVRAGIQPASATPSKEHEWLQQFVGEWTVGIWREGRSPKGSIDGADWDRKISSVRADLGHRRGESEIARRQFV